MSIDANSQNALHKWWHSVRKVKSDALVVKTHQTHFKWISIIFYSQQRKPRHAPSKGFAHHGTENGSQGWECQIFCFWPCFKILGLPSHCWSTVNHSHQMCTFVHKFVWTSLDVACCCVNTPIHNSGIHCLHPVHCKVFCILCEQDFGKAIFSCSWAYLWQCSVPAVQTGGSLPHTHWSCLLHHR